MAIREIPRAFEYQCDICGKTHEQKNASGHYTDSRPPHWTSLKIGADVYDYQGAAVADASVKRLVCDDCTPGLTRTINDWSERRKREVKQP